MGAHEEQPLAERLETLFRILKEVDSVAALGDEGEPEARTLAYSLLEIATSCRQFSDQLGNLSGESTGTEDTLSQLEELREELRHILYHIHDSRFLRVIDPSAEPR